MPEFPCTGCNTGVVGPEAIEILIKTNKRHIPLSSEGRVPDQEEKCKISHPDGIVDSKFVITKSSSCRQKQATSDRHQLRCWD